MSARMAPFYPTRRRLPNAGAKYGCAIAGSLGRMPFMPSKLCQTLTCLTGLLCVALWLVVPPLHSASSASSPVPRWARFELHQQDSEGDLQTGKPLTLLITLGGVAPGTVPTVALCESILFEPQVITLEPDAESSTFKAEVTLDPIP